MGTKRASTYRSEKDHQKHVEQHTNRQARATEAKIKEQEIYNEKVLKVSGENQLPQMTQDAKDMRMAVTKGMKAITKSSPKFFELIQVIMDVSLDLTTGQRWEKTQKVQEFANGLISPNEVDMYVEIHKDDKGQFERFTVYPVTEPQLKQDKPKQKVDVIDALMKSATGNAIHRESPPEDFVVKSPKTNPDQCTFSNPDGRTDGRGGVIRANSVYRERERMLNAAFGSYIRAPEPSDGRPERQPSIEIRPLN